MSYGHTITLDLPFQDAIARVKDAFGAQGFGTLTEIDVQATLKQKLGHDTDPYVILGTCNPQLAHQALQIEPEIGLLLPCNVVVRRQAGTTLVHALDPQVMVQVPNDPNCNPWLMKQTGAFAPPSTPSTRKPPKAVCRRAANHAGCTTASSAPAV
jgi:uncharacterized protein (DUF302 family)